MSARLSPHRILIALAVIVAASATSVAHAGLFRAFLSSSGNDANICTVQQPCRLLPAALNAVNDGGEIWMLDSANYNTSTVSITKSVSILAVPGAVGSVVANGGDAIAINAPTSNVSLRNVNVRPLSGGGVNGITIAAVGHLSLDNSVLENLAVGVSLTGAATISIRDSVFRLNTFGLRVNQSGDAAESLSIDHVNFIDNAGAINVLTNSISGFVRMTIDNSVIRGGGSGNGALAFGGGVAGAAPVNVSIAHTKIAGNGAGGVGVSSFGALTIVSIADCHISGWSNGGTRVLNGQSGVGAMQSLGNNFLVDNGSGEITGTITPQ